MRMLAKHFERSEFSCRCGCGFDTVDAELIRVLVSVRAYFGRPVHIHSGCRCVAHNRDVGGANQSQHLLGKASDIFIENVPLEDIDDYVDRKYPNDLGIGLYDRFIHIDVRNGYGRWSE